MALLHTQFTACGGAELLALTQARDLTAAGADVHIVTFALDASQWQMEFGDIPATVVPKRHWTDLPYCFDRALQLGKRGRRIDKVLMELDPDVVLAHDPPLQSMLGRATIRAMKLWYCHQPSRSLYPGVTSRHLVQEVAAGRLSHRPEMEAWARKRMGQDAHPGWEQKRSRAFDRSGISGLQRVATNSSFTRESLQLVYGTAGAMADPLVLPPMVPFGPAPERRGLHRQGLQVLMQGRLERLKNAEAVLHGFAAHRHRLGPAPCLHVVGTGDALPGLREEAAALGLGDSVVFHGFLRRESQALADIQRACDVFAWLPWDEPFGMVYPESAAAGLLLVGPDHGGPFEILDEGRIGWCLPPHHPEALGEALSAIWQMSDAEVDAKRASTYDACRVRYAPEAVLPRFRDWVRG